MAAVTLTITMSRISGVSSYVESAASDIIVIPNVLEWDVAGGFLTYKIGSNITLIPHTRIVQVTIS